MTSKELSDKMKKDGLPSRIYYALLDSFVLDYVLHSPKNIGYTARNQHTIAIQDSVNFDKDLRNKIESSKKSDFKYIPGMGVKSLNTLFEYLGVYPNTNDYSVEGCTKYLRDKGYTIT